MAKISTEIELVDGVSRKSENMVSSINKFGSALEKIQRIGDNVFGGFGNQKMSMNLQDANSMISTLQTKQAQIVEKAQGAKIFSSDSINDLNSLKSRIGNIQKTLTNIEKTPLKFNNASVHIQRLKTQLSETVSKQQELNSAVGKMDLKRVNAAYISLSQTIHDSEWHVREITNSQKKFNTEIDVGQKEYDKLTGKIKSAVAAFLSIRTLGLGVNLSDKFASSGARLDLIVDDSGSVQELEGKIFRSAQRSRSDYLDTIDIVSKLGLLAGKSFSNNNEMVAFAELMNKNFIIAGATTQEQQSAMYQLTQAMASGKLQGDEYRSIIENAPLLASSIEDYMRNVKKVKGSMKDWASDGLLTAGVIKSALFASTDEIEERFAKMPMTFAQIGTNIKNNALKQFKPILTKINKIANGSKFTTAVNGIIKIISKLATFAINVFNVLIKIISWIIENMQIIQPIIVGIVTAIGLWKLGIMALTVARGISKIMLYLHAKAVLADASVTDIHAIAAAKATVAQYGLNASLLAFPAAAVIGKILLVLVAFYVLIGVVNKIEGTAMSATGILIGTLQAAFALILNIVIGVLNAILQFGWTLFIEGWIGIFEWVVNVFSGGFNSFGDGVKNLLGQIISWFLSLGKVVTHIIDAIFGTNWTGGLNNLQENVLSWGTNENTIKFSREAKSMETLFGMQRWTYADAFDSGVAVGEGFDKKVQGMFNIFEKLNNEEDGTIYDLLNNIGKDVGDVKDNTGKTVDYFDLIRALANKREINRFTTAEIKVEMGGIVQKVGSESDLDGIVSALTAKIQEGVAIAAEGVHV